MPVQDLPADEAARPASAPGVVRKAFVPEETNFTPGETSDVSWITTDVVDHEGDVVVAAGIDYQSVFMKTRVVMAVHDYQRWPVGTCDWIKMASGRGAKGKFTGLVAKTQYDEDPDAQRLFGMVKRGLVRGKSIGFRPPEDVRPGEWGPPTSHELRARPDWAGAKRVIRRAVMLEYSVVPVPMNQEALVLAVSKGLELPSYLRAMIGPMAPAARPSRGDDPDVAAPSTALAGPPRHRTLAEVEKALVAAVGRRLDPEAIARRVAEGVIAKVTGQV
jgi:hypothetical protein